MKNILFLAAILLTNIAFGQNQPTSSFLENFNTLKALNKFELQQDPFLLYSSPDQELDIHQMTGEPFDLIQQNDSIYLWKWNTITEGWQVISKYVDIVYDNDHLIISETRLNWNGAEWVNAQHYIYTYENTQRTSTITKSWTGTAWENFLRTQSTYYSTDSVEFVEQQWEFNAWENSSRTFTAYDGNHNLINVTYQDWNQGWLPRDRYTFLYDTLNNLTYQLYEDALGIDWQNNSQTFHTYDNHNIRILSTNQLWDGFSWYNHEKSIYTKDSINNSNVILIQTWNGSFWVNLGKLTFTYNVNNNITYILGQFWNGFDWYDSNRFTTSYDGNRRIKFLSEAWNGSKWLKSSIQLFTYDENNFLLGRCQRDYDGTGDKVAKGDSTHYYFQTITGMENLHTDVSNIIVYPNPSNGKFNVSSPGSLGKIEIYDLAGKRVFASGPANDQTSMEIDLTRFCKGVYVVNINDGIKVISRKVVVQ